MPPSALSCSTAWASTTPANTNLQQSRLPIKATIKTLGMAKSESELRDDIVRVGQLIYQKGWVASNDGNISVRLDANRILCTPTNISKGMMKADDLIIVDSQGNKIEGKRERTSEILMHTTIYSLRPDIHAVCHSHLPVATGFAVAGRALSQ